MSIFKITVHILPHLIIGIKTTKDIHTIIRMAAKLNKFSLSSYATTYKMVVLTIHFVCDLFFK